MSRHTSALLGVALTELQKWDPAAAEQIAAHIPRYLFDRPQPGTARSPGSV